MIGSFLCILKNKVFIYMFILKCRIILVLVRLRCSCWGTIGALASVVLLFLNARPVVSDELARSSNGQWVLRISERKAKSFVFPSRRRTDEINESLNGPVQATGSSATKSGIGIERKNKTYFYKSQYVYNGPNNTFLIFAGHMGI